MRRISAALLLPLILTACTAKAPPAPEQPVSVPAVPVADQPKQQPATPASLRDQALALLQAGKSLEAAKLFAELAAKEPTADNWSDLSYAYLLGQDWQSALDAARKALDLNQDHPGAAYNAGMAALELGDTPTARRFLEQSAKGQPDRYEPHLGLLRLHLKDRNGPMSYYHMNEVNRLSGGSVDLNKEQQQLAGVVDPLAGTLPEAVVQSCTGEKVQKAGALTLCLYQDPSATGFFGYELYVLNGNQGYRMALGHFRPTPHPWHKAELPGGATGYWLTGLDFVVDHSQFHLFVIKEGAVTPVIFTGQPDANAGYFTDYVRSYQPPQFKGDLLEAYSRGPDGRTILQTRLRPAPNLATVQFVSSQLMSNK